MRADRAGHFVNRMAHDAELRARGIVLRKLGDHLEEPCPDSVVEVLARKALLGPQKPFDGFGPKIPELRVQVDDANALVGAQWIKCNHVFSLRLWQAGCPRAASAPPGERSFDRYVVHGPQESHSCCLGARTGCT